MKFSIIIPIYNGSLVIQRCLASLIPNRQFIEEVIIVDDSSTDDFKNKIPPFNSFFNIKVIPNSGDPHNPGAARKCGILAATAAWFTCLDVDDSMTDSCLRYVSQKIEQNPDIKVLQGQTIFYEFGNCVLKNIGVNVGSCGGRYYKREYIIANNLLPHDTLKMAEDQYFNTIINSYITFVQERPQDIYTYEYPLYEVHHDDGMPSFSFTNWSDYCIKYHLEMSQYIIEFMKGKGIDRRLQQDGMNDFIFSFFCYEGLLKKGNKKEQADSAKSLVYFKKFINYYEDTFHLNKFHFLTYYRTHSDCVMQLKQSARITMDIILDENYSFKQFLNSLD